MKSYGESQSDLNLFVRLYDASESLVRYPIIVNKQAVKAADVATELSQAKLIKVSENFRKEKFQLRVKTHNTDLKLLFLSA